MCAAQSKKGRLPPLSGVMGNAGWSFIHTVASKSECLRLYVISCLDKFESKVWSDAATAGKSTLPPCGPPCTVTVTSELSRHSQRLPFISQVLWWWWLLVEKLRLNFNDPLGETDRGTGGTNDINNGCVLLQVFQFRTPGVVPNRDIIYVISHTCAFSLHDRRARSALRHTDWLQKVQQTGSNI